jgi:hypothetical protein
VVDGKNFTFVKINKMWNKPIEAELDSENANSNEDSYKDDPFGAIMTGNKAAAAITKNTDNNTASNAETNIKRPQPGASPAK